MNTFKKISLTASLILSVVPILTPAITRAYGATPPGTSRACFSVDGTVIDLSGLPCIGSVCIDADFSRECQRRGGAWGIMPQYVGPGRTNAPIQSVNGALQVLVGIIRLFQIIFWVLTVGFGLYAAYLYLFSNGSKEATSKARQVLIYTVIAIIVSILAYSIPSVIDRFLS